MPTRRRPPTPAIPLSTRRRCAVSAAKEDDAEAAAAATVAVACILSLRADPRERMRVCRANGESCGCTIQYLRRYKYIDYHKTEVYPYLKKKEEKNGALAGVTYSHDS